MLTYLTGNIDIFIFILFSLIEGEREAAKDAYGGSNTSYPYNIHTHYLPIRGLAALICISFNTYSWDIWPLLLLSYTLVFPFIHDGAYYTFRKLLERNNPKLIGYHWFGQSETTTAFLSFNPVWRTVFFIFGICVYLISQLCGRMFTIG